MKKTIQELREERGWNKRELAQRMKIQTDILDRLERGAIAPEPAQLRNLSTIFNIPVNDIELNQRYRLVDVRGHCFVLTAHQEGRRQDWQAKADGYDWSQARFHPQGIIPGTEPPANHPTLILTGKWTATGATPTEALDGLEFRIREALEQAFTEGVRTLDPKGFIIGSSDN